MTIYEPRGFVAYYRLNRAQGRGRYLSVRRAVYLQLFWHWQRQMLRCLDRRIPRAVFRRGKAVPNDFLRFQNSLTTNHMQGSLWP